MQVPFADLTLLLGRVERRHRVVVRGRPQLRASPTRPTFAWALGLSNGSGTSRVTISCAAPRPGPLRRRGVSAGWRSSTALLPAGRPPTLPGCPSSASRHDAMQRHLLVRLALPHAQPRPHRLRVRGRPRLAFVVAAELATDCPAASATAPESDSFCFGPSTLPGSVVLPDPALPDSVTVPDFVSVLTRPAWVPWDSLSSSLRRRGAHLHLLRRAAPPYSIQS